MIARRAAVLLLAAATGCVPKARSPGFDPARTQKVLVWNTPGSERFQVVRRIEDGAEIDAFVGCLARAERVRSSPAPHTIIGSATHAVDIYGLHGGRWLLDAESGTFWVLTIKAGEPKYRLRESDLETVRRLVASAPAPSP